MKKPIFTYIITIFNSFFTASVVGVLGCMFVFARSEDGQPLEFKGLFFPSIVFGYIFCTIISLFYFFMIRRGKLKPRWLFNILLVVLSYAAVPVHAFVYAKTIGVNPDNYNEGTPIISLTFPALVVAIIGFILIGIFTKNNPNQSIEAIVTTPVESAKLVCTQPHLKRSINK